MPIIKSSSDLQRSFGKIADLAHETREPIYITRNGEASLVVMDADAFEAEAALREAVYNQEMKIRDEFERSEQEIAAGHEMTYDEYRLRRAERRFPQLMAENAGFDGRLEQGEVQDYEREEAVA